MKLKITYLETDYVITFEYDDPVTKCYLDCDNEPMFHLAVGQTRRHPKDSPNWVTARKTAFENMLKDAQNCFVDEFGFRNEGEYLYFYHIAWLHFLDEVKGRI